MSGPRLGALSNNSSSWGLSYISRYITYFTVYLGGLYLEILYLLVYNDSLYDWGNIDNREEL
jgi:hypothetical protein